ncbi:hypothetical protein [Micromonospora lutea]|uniref:hypothetical protein n=1 Tax=Micromonospora lutea TaxID=419825 RepID=UPI00194DC1F6|nr:hypothetical protein [Micromonospora lutea]
MIALLSLSASVAALAVAAVSLLVALRTYRSAVTGAAVERLAEQVTVIGRAVSAYCEADQEERVNGQARRVSLQLGDTYRGGQDLPGAVEVEAVNQSAEVIHRVSFNYRPAVGEPQASEATTGLVTIQPYSSFRHVFALPPGTSNPVSDEFELCFTDARSRRWRRLPGRSQLWLIGSDDPNGTQSP